MRKQDLYLFRQLCRNVHFYLLPTQKMRSRYIRKNNLFDMCGDNLFWQPRKLPSDLKCIRIHNNVKVSADVNFITHDTIYDLINHMDETAEPCKEALNCIEVMDNVMIGLGTLILPGVRIGKNVIIGAGSVVTKDIPDGSVAAGVPARVIGRFDDVIAKQRAASKEIKGNSRFEQERIDEAWEAFGKKHKKGTEGTEEN